MKDWRLLAKAGGLDIPSAELERVIDPLTALEEAFRPLVKDLSPELEPVTVYLPEEGE